MLQRPDSYVERVQSVGSMSDLPSTSIAGFIGETVRGIPNKAIKVTSWKQFQDSFALGVVDPFAKGNVADAVYGFFLNGGSEAWIVRTLTTGSTKATVTVPTTTGVGYEALEEGLWGNSLSVVVASTSTGVFSLTVSLGGNKVEVINKLTVANFRTTINATSKYVRVKEGETSIAVGSGNLAGATEPVSNDATFIGGLSVLDTEQDINLLAIPGITITGVQEALVNYCANRNTIFPIIDAPVNATVEEIQDFKDKMTSHLGAIYYPRIVIKNPVTGVQKTVATSGYLSGVYARTDSLRGIHKAPAGLEATIRGAIAVERNLSDTEIGILNDNEVNCILPKRGSGIVSWGARMLKPDGDRQFVSDIRLDMYVEEAIKRGTEWAVFEPKDEQLFNNLTSALKGLMMNMWNEGKLLGATPEEAFFVKCDADLNPDILSSELIIEVGYAKKKPSEFIVTRVSHKQS